MPADKNDRKDSAMEVMVTLPKQADVSELAKLLLARKAALSKPTVAKAQRNACGATEENARGPANVADAELARE